MTGHTLRLLVVSCFHANLKTAYALKVSFKTINWHARYPLIGYQRQESSACRHPEDAG